MINKIFKDFSDSELMELQRNYPQRYDNLCKAIGEFALSKTEVNLAISLPCRQDYGIIMAFEYGDEDSTKILASIKI